MIIVFKDQEINFYSLLYSETCSGSMKVCNITVLYNHSTGSLLMLGDTYMYA